MASSWQTVRVFISSTFRDMHAERDYLVKYVFPDLREWCERWKLHLVDIDLRWGVTAAEAESGKVIDICLEQIDGSRPFFICMLGNRYGHVPKPGDVPQTTRERYDRLKDKEDYSITHLEIHHAILEPLKSLDALEQTPHAFFYFRDEHSLPRPEDVRGLDDKGCTLYQEVFFEKDPDKTARLNDLKGKIKRHYEQLGKERNNSNEIFERIFIYKPEFDPNIPNPEDDEFKKGRLTRKSLKEFGERVKEDLKKAISQQFKDRIAALSGKVEEDALETERNYHESFVEHRIRSFIGRTGHLNEIRDYVEGDSTRILAVYGEAGSGKSALLAKFYKDYKYDKDGSEISKDVLFIPHFVGASPGSSALHNLLRRLCEELLANSLKNEMEQCLAGVTRTGENAQKERDAIRKEYEISSDINKLPETFRSFLAKVKGKTVILIDGLNQLDETERAHDLNWLPNELPKNVRIIASTLEGDTKEALERKNIKRVVISPLTDEERRNIIREMPSVFCKTLDDEHIKALLEKKETANPLYLKAALEELRIYGGFGKKGERLKELIEEFPPDVVDMFIYILNRLERDVREGAEERDKSWIAERFFCLLECSRYGLTSGELRELMADDAENLYQGILRQIRDYLLNRGELIDFFHRELSKAIRKKYLRDGDASRWHRVLAEYFQTKPLYLETEDKKVPNTRKLVEQPWQQTRQGSMWDELEKTLTDLNFIEAKCAAGMTYELIMDYNMALDGLPEAQKEKEEKQKRDERMQRYIHEMIEYAKKWNDARFKHYKDPVKHPMPKPEDIPLPEIIPSVRPWTDEEIDADTQRIINNPTRLDKLKIFSQFVNAEAHNFIKYASNPKFCIQQAYNSADAGLVHGTASKILENDTVTITILHKKSSLPPFNLHPGTLRTLEGHTRFVIAASLTPDGCLAVSGSLDNTLRVWDVETGHCLHTLKGHTKKVNAVSLTPDGRRAVSGSDDETLRVWDVETGQCLRTLEGHTFDVNAVSLTPDGRLVVSGDFWTLRVWDVESGQCLRTLEGDQGWFVMAASLTPDGRRAVSGGAGTLRVWDVESGQCLRTLEGHTRQVSAVSITPDGCCAVSGSLDKTLRVWDVESGQCLHTLEGHTNWVSAVSLTPDGRRAVSGSWDNKLRVWDVETGQCLRTLEGHTNWVSAVSLTLDGRRAVSGGAGILRVWDVESGQCLRTLEGHTNNVWPVSTTKDGRCAVVLSSEHKTWSIHYDKDGLYMRTLEGHADRVNELSLTSDGRRAVSGSDDETLRVWDVESGQCLHTLTGHSDRVLSLAVTPDGRRAVSGGSGDFDYTLRVWDVENGRRLRTLRGHTGAVMAVSLTPDGRLAVSGSDDETLRVWDVESGRCLRTLEGHTCRVYAVILTSDGRHAVSGGAGTLRVWDVESGQCLRTLKGRIVGVSAISLIQDGCRTIWARWDKTLRVWDIESVRRLRTLKRITQGVFALSLTPEGSLAVSESDDGTLWVWDVETGKKIAIVALAAPVTTFDLKGYQIITGDALGKVSFLDIQHMKMDIHIATSLRLWQYGIGGKPGKWDDNITAICDWCGKIFVVSEEILDTIKSINRNARLSPEDAPCLKLPREAWDDPRLVSECPHCHQPLKFNPFIVDNSDRSIFDSTPKNMHIYKNFKIAVDLGNLKFKLNYTLDGDIICPLCEMESKNGATFCIWCKWPFR